jgi:hypothetical protein
MGVIAYRDKEKLSVSLCVFVRLQAQYTGLEVSIETAERISKLGGKNNWDWASLVNYLL